MLIISPTPFISQSSPELIFHIMKARDQTSVLLSVLLVFVFYLHFTTNVTFNSFLQNCYGRRVSLLNFAHSCEKLFSLQCCNPIFSLKKKAISFIIVLKKWIKDNSGCGLCILFETFFSQRTEKVEKKLSFIN